VVQTLEKYQSTHAFYIHGHGRYESDFETFTEILKRNHKETFL